MRKAIVALIIVLVATSLVGLVLFFSGGNIGNGRGYGAQTGQSSEGQRSLWLIVFAVPLAVAVVVAVYAMLSPQIKMEKKTTNPETAQPTETKGVTPQAPITEKATTSPPPAESAKTLDAVLRVLNPDERKVVETLASSGDRSMLQRDIKWNTGLSRVKTHRVLARLTARGIVKVEKYYNTNRVSLAEWIAKGKTEE
jgi:uncharacterized membrane protein